MRHHRSVVAAIERLLLFVAIAGLIFEVNSDPFDDPEEEWTCTTDNHLFNTIGAPTMHININNGGLKTLDNAQLDSVYEWRFSSYDTLRPPPQINYDYRRNFSKKSNSAWICKNIKTGVTLKGVNGNGNSKAHTDKTNRQYPRNNGRFDGPRKG